MQVGLDLGAAGIVAAPLGVILKGELVGMRGYVACDPWISASQQTCLISVIDQIKKGFRRKHTRSQTGSSEVGILIELDVYQYNNITTKSCFSFD